MFGWIHKAMVASWPSVIGWKVIRSSSHSFRSPWNWTCAAGIDRGNVRHAQKFFSLLLRSQLMGLSYDLDF